MKRVNNILSVKYYLKAILFAFILIMISSCAQTNLMSGKQYSDRQQNYYNYEAAMKRNKAGTLDAAKDALAQAKEQEREAKKKAKEKAKIDAVNAKTKAIKNKGNN